MYQPEQAESTVGRPLLVQPKSRYTQHQRPSSKPNPETVLDPSTQPQPLRPHPLLTLHPVAWLLPLAATLSVLLNIAVFRLWFAHPGNDQAWLLYAAGRVLHGQVLYGPRVIETNPPLVVWFSEIPMQLALWLHADPLTILRILVSAMLLGSVLWCVRILRAAGLAANALTAWLWGLALFAAQVSQHGNDFGQKEQLLIALLAPYLLYGAVTCAALGPILNPASAYPTTAHVALSLPERLALGLAAGLGVSLKPQDALALIAFELFLLLWNYRPRRLLRPELLAVVATGVLYVLAVRLFTPLYLTQIVPLLTDTYWAFGEYTVLEILRDRSTFNLFCLLTFLAWFFLRKRFRYPAAPPALLASALGAALGFALQNKNWPYQFFPQQALLCFAVAWVILDPLTPSLVRIAAPAAATVTRSRHFGAALLALTALFTAALLPLAIHLGRTHNSAVSQTPDSQFLDAELARCPPGTPVMLLSIDLMGTSDILQNHLVEGARYHHLWLLPALILNEWAAAGGPPARHPIPPARLAYLENLLRSNVADDLRTRQPALVLIPHCKSTPDEPCQGLYGHTFDILAWFLRSPGFASAWTHYRHQAGDDFFDAYTRVQ